MGAAGRIRTHANHFDDAIVKNSQERAEIVDDVVNRWHSVDPGSHCVGKFRQSIDTEEFPVVSLNDKHRKWITEALERAFAKSSPVVYANAHGMINGEEEEEEEDDAN